MFKNPFFPIISAEAAKSSLYVVRINNTMPNKISNMVFKVFEVFFLLLHQNLMLFPALTHVTYEKG